MRRIGSWKSWSKKRKVTTGVCGVCVIAVVAGAIGLSGGSDTEVIYKETTVKYGTLVKGVTESGSVDIGTVDQTSSACPWDNAWERSTIFMLLFAAL